jgi:hypothetical protein
LWIQHSLARLIFLFDISFTKVGPITMKPPSLLPIICHQLFP